MQGSIRAFVGFMVAYGAVGTLDAEPNASVIGMTALAIAGLAIMFSGVRSMNGVK